MSLLLDIDARSAVPLYRQIIARIAALAESGALPPGARLPASRALAAALGVDRSTVCRAFQELWALGYVESRPGSFTTIRRRSKVVAAQSLPRPSRIDWAGRPAAGSPRLQAAWQGDQTRRREVAAAGVIDFIPLSPDPRLLPVTTFRQCLQAVLLSQGAELLQYGDPRGYGPLRETIAARLRTHGLEVTPEEILITAGAQGAIDLLLRFLAGPGDAVAVEAPTYPRVLDALCLQRLRARPVPMTPAGMDLSALGALAAREPLAAVYTIPNFHNPTGVTTDQAHREGLLDICERLGLPRVEDGFEEEMKYFGKTVLPIKSMDHSGVVLYLGTFSKILFPGLRIGWIAGHRDCIARLAPLQRTMMLCGNPLDQAALDRFCRAGHYERHVRRMHQVYRRRMQTALKALQAQVDPELCRWHPPAGGYTIWLQLAGRPRDEAALAAHLLRHGVAVLPGRAHYCGPGAVPGLRLSIAHLDEAAIAEGVRRLGRGLALFRSSRGGRRAAAGAPKGKHP
jgi:DNA-binding transcriptional MocR family regulator